jgi:hypothetical protein
MGTISLILAAFRDGGETPHFSPWRFCPYATGINDSGQVVGYYSEGNRDHGFLATLLVAAPEPGSLVLFGIAAIPFVRMFGNSRGIIRHRKVGGSAVNRRVCKIGALPSRGTCILQKEKFAI